MCRIERPFARTLNGQAPPRYSLWIPVLPGTTLVWHVPLWIPACAGMTSGRASAVWLAFVGGASVCPASEPCSYNGLNNRVSAAFRPSLQTSLTTCGGHRRRIRVLATPCRPARCLFTLFSCRFFCLASAGCAFPGRGDVSFFRCAVPECTSDRRLLFILLHMWCGVKSEL